MSLKIVVLAKQVPDTRNVGKDAMTAEGTVNRAALPAIFNPEDLNALEQALRIKEQNPDTTVGLLTMGPPRAGEIIREGLYLNPNCDRQMLTDRFGLTKERLGSLFVQYSDAKNVSAYINGLRLAHAAHLLTTQPELDIREVAAASGFGSHQYFSTCFKQRFGLSPTDYRSAKGL